jgi:hypothetical protein
MKRVTVTGALRRQLVYLAEHRHLARRRAGPPGTTLTQCRDQYWAKYPAWQARAGKALYQVLQSTKGRGMDDASFRGYIVGLTESELQRGIEQIKQLIGAAPTIVGHGGQGVPQSEDEEKPQPAQVLVCDGQTPDDPVRCPIGFQAVQSFVKYNETLLTGKRSINMGGTNQLRARIQRLLLATTQSKVKRGMDDGALDPNRFQDIAAGINLTGLYTQRQSGQAMSTAVQLYLDCSGSTNAADTGMRGFNRLDAITEVGAAVSHVLRQLRVPHQIILFRNCSCLIKDWDGRLPAHALSEVKPGGGTYLGSCMRNGLPEFDTRHERRKVAFILTDGDVECARDVVNQHRHIETCAFQIARSEAMPTDLFDVTHAHLQTSAAGNFVHALTDRIAQMLVHPVRGIRRA